MNLHAEVLPSVQQEALRTIGGLAGNRGFYLAGGTAVALHLGHRQSIDLDWFAEQEPHNPMALAKEFQNHGVSLKLGSVQRGALYIDVSGVRMSFLEFAYPLLQPPIRWEWMNCSIASLDDLAAMKLLAVAQRGTKKDFLDVYALGLHGLSLAHMFACYRRKFSTQDVARVTYSLCYFDDADPEPMPTMLVDSKWSEVKDAIRSWVKATASPASGD